MATVVVLAGGNSDEREVSARSGAAVTSALQRAGHSVEQIDPAYGLHEEVLLEADVVFPVLHGQGGEDGSLQRQLDDLGVVYVGSGAAASELCFDKWPYKRLLQANDLPTPDGKLVDMNGFHNSTLSLRPFV